MALLFVVIVEPLLSCRKMVAITFLVDLAALNALHNRQPNTHTDNHNTYMGKYILEGALKSTVEKTRVSKYDKLKPCPMSMNHDKTLMNLVIKLHL